MRKKIGTFILSAGMIFTLASCSSGSSNSLEGTWTLKSASSGSSEVTQEQLQASEIGGTTFTFNKDGKVEIRTSDSDNEVGEGNYTLDGEKVTIFVGEETKTQSETASESAVSANDETETFSGTLKDGQLTITQKGSENLSLILEKK